MEELFQRLGVHREFDRHWAVEILIFTRHWIHYGWMAFVLLLSLTAAAEGLLGR